MSDLMSFVAKKDVDNEITKGKRYIPIRKITSSKYELKLDSGRWHIVDIDEKWPTGEMMRLWLVDYMLESDIVNPTYGYIKCCHPIPHVTVGEVYRVLEQYVGGTCLINDDDGDKMYAEYGDGCAWGDCDEFGFSVNNSNNAEDIDNPAFAYIKLKQSLPNLTVGKVYCIKRMFNDGEALIDSDEDFELIVDTSRDDIWEFCNASGIGHAKSEDITCEIQKSLNWHKIVCPEPTAKTAGIQLGVALEETSELNEAFGDFGLVYSLLYRAEEYKIGEAGFPLPLSESENVKVLDAIADEIYTRVGLAHHLGYDILGALAEVHRSNMSKLEDGKPIFDENGKVAKGREYSPPNLKPFIGKGI